MVFERAESDKTKESWPFKTACWILPKNYLNDNYEN